MQQTKNFKLNLIETSDAFSPAPLNENAQKTEAALDALHAADAQVGLDRIAGPLVCTADSGELAIDVSGLDMARYTAMLAIFSGEHSPRGCSLLLNGLSDIVLLPPYSSTQYYPVTGLGCALFAPVGETIFGMTKVFATVVNAPGMDAVYHRIIELPWRELATLTTVRCTPGCTLSLYGLRA